MTSVSPLSAAFRFFPARSTAPLKADYALLEKIRGAEGQLSSAPNDALDLGRGELQQRIAAGERITNAEVMVPACALLVEAARRVLGIELYDVQLLGGLALARGAIAEMLTGEGKTYVAMLPAFLHALAGEGVHVMTVNPYLAKRDFELLTPVYNLLGVSVGLLQADQVPDDKRAAYARHITYGPGFEFGFDYLRDQAAKLARRRPRLGESVLARLHGEVVESRQVQRGLAVAIIDEADSVMIDEATTPLVLSGRGESQATNADVFQAATETARKLEIDQHFVVDQAAATVRLTNAGLRQLADAPRRIACAELDRAWHSYVEHALHALHLFQRDVHYVVKNDKILIVDQNTGYIYADRSWRQGLSQAVQAKEGVTITSETLPIAQITRQRYFRLYRQLCGLTGTAQGSERELQDVYGLKVVVTPPHRACLRTALPTRAFVSAAEKEAAIADEIERRHRAGRPVLVGTASIESSQRLARLTEARRIPAQLLNGLQDAEEAAIVSQAGRPGAVTIATNMAGRGTDIQLDDAVRRLGGLHVIVAEPQESSRIDRQLVGRAARQGDPGSGQLFVSADDRLIARHAPALAQRIRQLADARGEIQTDISADIIAVQQQVERKNAQRRRKMFAHDDWLESVLKELGGLAPKQQ